MNRRDNLATVLVLDGEGSLAARIESSLRDSYRLIRVSQPEQAVALARERRVHVFVVHGREDGGAALHSLRQIRELSPCTLGILLAGKEHLRTLLPTAREGDLFRVAQDLEELQGFIGLAADQSSAFYAAVEPTAAVEKRPCVLVLDEDTATAERVREALRLEPGQPRSVYWCDTLYEAFDALARRPVGLLVTDVRLDGEDISGGLRTLRGCHPEVATVIHSSTMDTSGFSDLIGNGCMLVPKPASRERLVGALAAAMHPLARAAFIADVPPRSGSGRVRTMIGKLGW